MILFCRSWLLSVHVSCNCYCNNWTSFIGFKSRIPKQVIICKYQGLFKYYNRHFSSKIVSLYYRSARSPSKSNFFSNPLVVNSTLGILSSIEILVAFLFIVFLAWTYYSRISSDFKKLVPYKSLKLNT